MIGRFRMWSLALLMLPGCWPEDSLNACDTELETEVPSETGAYLAAVFHRECGATTGFNTQVALRKRTDRFDPRQGQVLSLDGHHRLELIWRGDRRLEVRVPAERIYVQKDRWHDVRLEYTGGRR